MILLTRLPIMRFRAPRKLIGTATRTPKVVAINAKKTVSTIFSKVRVRVSLICQGPSSQLIIAFTI